MFVRKTSLLGRLVLARAEASCVGYGRSQKTVDDGTQAYSYKKPDSQRC